MRNAQLVVCFVASVQNTIRLGSAAIPPKFSRNFEARGVTALGVLFRSGFSRVDSASVRILGAITGELFGTAFYAGAGIVDAGLKGGSTAAHVVLPPRIQHQRFGYWGQHKQ